MFQMLYADIVNAVQSPSDKILASVVVFGGMFSFVGGFCFVLKHFNNQSTHPEAQPLIKGKT